MKKSILATLLAVGFSASMTLSARSILDIKQSITDDNIIAPESFETQTRLLEENFYIKNYVVPGVDLGEPQPASPAEYEERLKVLPTVIEMPYNSLVGNFINMYLTKKRTLVADMLALHSYYGPIFVEELIKEGMPTELQYLPVIESAINPNAISRAGAAGLWQFMPATAKGLGMEVNSLVDERRDARLSSRNAARYLKQLYDIYNDWSLAIAAYNCGPGNVNKAMRRAGEGKKDFWEIYEFLPAETRGYVPVFIAANYVMNYYGKHGISPTIIKRHLTTDTVTVDKYIHFNQIAAVLN
ncbi:MAG: lytic transglycosylase domain-containing protein, partial [Duncaniella sp.]|nr:lytic transglycosylase domain-containing protein [Duncaniella sp.]